MARPQCDTPLVRLVCMIIIENYKLLEKRVSMDSLTSKIG